MKSTIQNVVSTAYIGSKIDLASLSRRLFNVEYNPSKFIAAIIRIRKPATTCLLFSSGRLVVVGAKSVEESYKASRIFARKIQKHAPIKTTFKNFSIHNIVGSFSMNHKIDIKSFYYSKAKNCLYVPESFPGLKYKLYADENIIALVFGSGRIVITGAKTVEKVQEATETMNRLLLKYKK